MTVFGRDTLITSLQTLLFGPELARGALEALAELQAASRGPVDRRRAGQDRPRGAPRQGGRELVQALLRHRRRDAALPDPALGGLALDGRRGARALAARAGAARARVDRRVRRPRRRRLRRVRAAHADGPREPVLEGFLGLAALLRRHARAHARSPRSRCRGTSTTPSCASPSSPASSGASASSRSGSSSEAAELRQRFDQAFWIPEHGGYYALALDGDKRPVDSLCSNIGHLLWSGIVPPERVDAVVDALMGDQLWSGWGVRTMSIARRRLQPDLVPQRLGLAARQLPDRGRAGAVRSLAGGAADHPPHHRRREELRAPAP